MNESKIELTERLRREGRWAEASKFKDTVLAECRAKGFKRDEASEAAWKAMEQAYPSIAAVASTTDIREEEPTDTRVQGLSEVPAGCWSSPDVGKNLWIVVKMTPPEPVCSKSRRFDRFEA